MTKDRKLNLEICIAMVIACLAVVIKPILHNLLPDNPYLRLGVNMSIYGLLALGTLLRVRKLSDQPLRYLGYCGDNLPRQFLWGVGIGLASLSLFVLLPLIFGVPAWAVLSGKAPTPGIIPMRVVFYLFFVGPVEELIFRGYLFRRLEELTKGPWQQCLVSALLFGLWHFPASHSLINVLYCGAIGFFFGMFYIRKKDCSLLSLGLAHGLHDLGIFVLSQFLR